MGKDYQDRNEIQKMENLISRKIVENNALKKLQENLGELSNNKIEISRKTKFKSLFKWFNFINK